MPSITLDPTPLPTSKPSAHPTRQPTRQPTFQPFLRPTRQPTRSVCNIFIVEGFFFEYALNYRRQPSGNPSSPSTKPTGEPSQSKKPTTQPTRRPTRQPSRQPSKQPSSQPTRRPTTTPKPSSQPSRQPTHQPSRQPSSEPSTQPSQQPSSTPTRFLLFSLFSLELSEPLVHISISTPDRLRSHLRALHYPVRCPPCSPLSSPYGIQPCSLPSNRRNNPPDSPFVFQQSNPRDNLPTSHLSSLLANQLQNPPTLGSLLQHRLSSQPTSQPLILLCSLPDLLRTLRSRPRIHQSNLHFFLLRNQFVVRQISRPSNRHRNPACPLVSPLGSQPTSRLPNQHLCQHTNLRGNPRDSLHDSRLIDPRIHLLSQPISLLRSQHRNPLQNQPLKSHLVQLLPVCHPPNLLDSRVCLLRDPQKLTFLQSKLLQPQLLNPPVVRPQSQPIPGNPPSITLPFFPTELYSLARTSLPVRCVPPFN